MTRPVVQRCDWCEEIRKDPNDGATWIAVCVGAIAGSITTFNFDFCCFGDLKKWANQQIKWEASRGGDA